MAARRLFMAIYRVNRVERRTQPVLRGLDRREVIEVIIRPALDGRVTDFTNGDVAGQPLGLSGWIWAVGLTTARYQRSI